MLRLVTTALLVAAVSVSACGGSSPRPGEGETGGAGGGGTGGAAGTGGSGGGTVTTPDGGTYDAPPVPGSVSIEMAPALVAGVVCEKIYACCQPTEGLRPVTMTQAACDLLVSGTLGALMSQANAAIARGRATYDAAALAACLKKYTEQTCAQARASGGVSFYRSCDFVKPLVPIDGACNDSVECIDGYCDGMGAGVEGKCVAKKANGEACMADDECTGRRCTVGPPRECAQATTEGLCGLPGGA